MFVIYLIVYGYACHMTSVEPDKPIWGYICALVFAILFTWGISIFVKNQKNKSENNKENL
jgi:hypothetical protein